MKTATGQLTSSLYGWDVHSVADLFTFTFSSETKRWTTAGRDITSGSTTWDSDGVMVKRDTITNVAGLEVDDIGLSLHPVSGTTVNGMTLQQAALAGEFDNIPVTVERAFFDPTGSLAGRVDLFSGTVVEVLPNSTNVEVRVKSAVAAMRQPFPHRIMQAQCPYQLYDTSCGVDVNDHVEITTVGLGSTDRVLKLSSLVTSSLATPGSSIRMVGGDTADERRVIIAASGTDVTLQAPLSTTPQSGDFVLVYRGCDKRRATCSGTFSNVARFGGFPDGWY